MSESNSILVGDISLSQLADDDALQYAEKKGWISSRSPTHELVDKIEAVINDRLCFADLGFASNTAFQLQGQLIESLSRNSDDGRSMMHQQWVFPGETHQAGKDRPFSERNPQLPILVMLNVLKRVARYGRYAAEGMEAPASLQKLLSVADGTGQTPLHNLNEGEAKILADGLLSREYASFRPVFKDAVPPQHAHLFIDAPGLKAATFSPRLSPS